MVELPIFSFRVQIKNLIPLCFLSEIISEAVDLKHPLTGETMIGVATWLVGEATVGGICSLKLSS